MLLEAQTISVPSVRDGTNTHGALPNPAGGMGGGLVGQTALSLLPFREIWAVDFEFIVASGGNPVPTCLVAWELRSRRKIRMWSDEFGSKPPYPTGPDVLFVAYYASAEIGCHLALGWPVPARILDLFTEFRNHTNGLPTVAGNGLVGALAHFGLDSIGAEEKDTMRALVLRGGPWAAAGKADILDYCETDVAALSRLLPRLLPHVDLQRALLRGRYMAAAAGIERNGVPINVDTLELLRRHWDGIQFALIEDVDQGYGVFEGGTFKHDLFAGWLAGVASHGPDWIPEGWIYLTRLSDRWRAPIRKCRRCANCASPFRKCGSMTWPSAATAVTAVCCRHSRRELAATSRATPSSSSGRACGCVG